MAEPTETVVLLHGLGRTQWSMRPMERFLAKGGFRTVNLRYPSRKKSAEDLVEFLSAELDAASLLAGGPVHFVTHSAGGILARAYLAGHPDFPVGRVVMLAPPNKGSQVASRLRQYLTIRFLVGPLLMDLADAPDAVPASLPPPPYPVGVVAGSRASIFLLPWLVAGPNDGVVSIEETKVDGMADFFVAPRSHTFIMNNRKVQRQTLAFLRTGRFDHSATHR